ncbi:TIGR03032 family protein [Verrucomicrobiota bacterium sgz303538]
MFQLESEFYRLPLRFDAARLAKEVLQFREDEWCPHPQGHPGNSALPLVSVNGEINDAVKGPMRPTPFLARCPYIQQVLAGLGAVIGRARLMRIAGQSDAHEHVDTNYYWMHHVRVHIPAVTWPEVRFLCGGKSVHMAAGEAWIFDSWKRHNVLNPVDTARIHLVADTVGSDSFWDLVVRSGRTGDSRSREEVPPQPVPFVPGAKVEIEWEEENYPVVMSPFEQQALAGRMLASLPVAARESSALQTLTVALERLHQQWHALWARFRDGRAGWQRYAETMLEFDRRLPELAGELSLVNGVPLGEALRQAIVRPALSPEVARQDVHGPKQEAPQSRQNSHPHLGRPVFIVSAPRSGSTMLFELLSRSPDVWTIGGESHAVIEGIPGLHPAQRNYDSNRLTSADADPGTIQTLHAAFMGCLRDRDGRTWNEARGAVRMLEKTPKNALRIQFLAEAFPDALFIFLHRDPREDISSILDAWRSGRFVTYPQLPGWSGLPWSMLLIPKWTELVGKPLGEIAARQWMVANEQIMEDLVGLPRDRWCAVSYEETVSDPQAVAKRLCAFAGWRWDQPVESPLPLSAHTLTPPDPEKWRNNEAELETVLPQTEEIAARVRAFARGELPTRRAMPQRAAATMVANFESQHSESFPELLAACGCSLAVSTYQAGKVILLRARAGMLNTHFRDFQSPMGIAWRPGWLAVGAKQEVWTFRNFHDLGPKLAPDAPHDAVFLPGMRFTSGDIRIHEIGWAGEQLWAVNTRFSCLCTFDGEHNFVPRWRPPFISSLAADDRCHLNGMALVDGMPAYVTCHSASDQPQGWRERKVDGGVIVEVHTGEILATGLSMPHSPRFYDGRLWFLESGRGRVCTLDLDSGKIETVAELPGFTRGLDFHGPYAFVGLSQVRESAVFSGIPISADDRQRECGVWVIDIRSGRTVALLRFSGDVQEIFSVQVLPGMGWPELLNDESDWVAATFYLPPEVSSTPTAT